MSSSPVRPAGELLLIGATGFERLLSPHAFPGRVGLISLRTLRADERLPGDLVGSDASVNAATRSEEHKRLVRRLVEEVVNRRNPDALDELAEGEFATTARRWINPFRSSFPDFTMEIVELVAENDVVVAHFRCSGTHRGEWLGFAPTGRRFERVDEIYIFRVENGKLSSAVGVEDNLSRMRQLGIGP
jgi:predicted ester cyclase